MKFLFYFMCVLTGGCSIGSATRLVCYYPNWSQYRSDIGKYGVSNIDPSLCTHLIYAFAILNNVTYNSIVVFDPWGDTTLGGYANFVALKKQNPQLKTTIAIGGWTDSTDGTFKYSKLVASSANIATFTVSVVNFLNQYGFDGLDIDWEYPHQNATDKAGFSNLITSLRTAFNPYGFLLSAAVSANQTIIDLGYDVAVMNEQLDFINLMTYDMHGSWEPMVDNLAPLYQRPWETVDNNNVDFIVKYWISKGLSPDKINMGIPLYGNGWTLSSSNTSLLAPASGPSPPGPYSATAGILTYYEICNYIQTAGWTTVEDPLNQTGPYAFSADAVNKAWVGYNDVYMTTIKSEYVLSMGLGGAMVWDMSEDDSKNICGGGTNPLITSIHKTVIGSVATETTTTPGTTTKRFICYYPDWSQYRPGIGAYGVGNINPSLCTHLIYAFAVLNNVTFNTIEIVDTWGDITLAGYAKFVALKQQNPQLKTMIAIGGFTDSTDGTWKYSKLVANSNNIATFTTSVVTFLHTYGFDGLDLDWEYPYQNETDKAGFANLITSLRTAFNPYGFLLSAAVSANQTIIDLGYDVGTMNQMLDFVNLMAYDMHGSWEPVVDNHAPLYKRSWETVSNNNVDFIVNYWLSKGLSADKLNMGIPVYGRSWTLSSSNTSVLAPAYYGTNAGGAPGPYTQQKGFLGYYEICNNTLVSGWTVVQDPLNQTGPYAYSADAVNKIWIGYDDVHMAIIKSDYVISRGLGGAMVWDISMDDFMNVCGAGVNPIMSAIYQNVVLSGVTTTATITLSTVTATPNPTSTASTTTMTTSTSKMSSTQTNPTSITSQTTTRLSTTPSSPTTTKKTTTSKSTASPTVTLKSSSTLGSDVTIIETIGITSSAPGGVSRISTSVLAENPLLIVIFYGLMVYLLNLFM